MKPLASGILLDPTFLRVLSERGPGPGQGLEPSQQEGSPSIRVSSEGVQVSGFQVGSCPGEGVPQDTPGWLCRSDLATLRSPSLGLISVHWMGMQGHQPDSCRGGCGPRTWRCQALHWVCAPSTPLRPFPGFQGPLRSPRPPSSVCGKAVLEFMELAAAGGCGRPLGGTQGAGRLRTGAPGLDSGPLGSNPVRAPGQAESLQQLAEPVKWAPWRPLPQVIRKTRWACLVSPAPWLFTGGQHRSR